MIPTGVAVAIPDGHAGLVLPRSGLASKQGLTLANAPGLIDAGYRGELIVAVVNLDRTERRDDHEGERIAQLVIVALPWSPGWVDELPDSAPRDGRVRLDGQRMNIRLERTDDRDASLRARAHGVRADLEAEIARAVADEEGSFALVAEDGDTMIGHVQMSRGWVGATPVLALGPIGVLPERQGQGCGGALVRAALEEAARRGERIVMLLGSPAYYPRFGFVPASTFGLRNPYAGEAEDGFEIAEEGFMVARLDEAPLALEGAVRWHPAFDEAG